MTIVFKRTSAPYEPGPRSSAWVKVKHAKSDALIMRSLERWATDQCSFARPPMLSDLVWIEPALVVEVRSLGSALRRWLREPVFSRVVRMRALT